ncbi:MAG: TolC family protein [Blastocatellia bacterium]
MQIRKLAAHAIAAMTALAWLAAGGRAQQSPPAEAPVTLEALERMAMRNNPTLAQADAAIRAAEGRRKQAGLWPNPTVGYTGEGLAFNSLVYPFRNEHYVFVEQTFITAGKLGKSRQIAAEEKNQAQAIAEAQRLRVLNSVRMLYFEALGAQQLVELRKQLAGLTREAVAISDDLYNVGQADRPDVLASEVESQRAEIDLLRAENDLARIWGVLAAVVNDPQLRPARLAGMLETEAPKLDRDELLAMLLRESPEMKAAMAGVDRARAIIRREKAEPKPDLFVRGSVGYSRDWAEFFGGRVGWDSRFEAGVRLPIFNRNQGNVAAAQAGLLNAEKEMLRVELTLRARLADSYTRYLNSLGIASRYSRDILPKAQRSYDMYLAKFRQMAAAYPQVLISQRTLFHARTEYVGTLVELWQNITQLRGLLLTSGLAAPGAIPSVELGGHMPQPQQ